MEHEATSAAAALMSQHAGGVKFQPFAAAFGIGSIDDAYAVQREYVRLQMLARGTSAAGYKIGLTAKRMQEMCGIDSPVSGYVAASRIYTSPATVDAMEYTHIGLEFEIAVKIGRDLPFPPGQYSQEEVIRDIRVAPGVELVDDRNCDYATLEALSLIADNSWNAGIVVGEWREPPADLGAIEGVVQSGDRRGRELGYPTANMSLSDYQRPKYGIYAVRVTLDDGSEHPGVASLGVRPTFSPPQELLEAHLFGFDGDLYGRKIEVALHAFIREERKFDSIDALVAEMRNDEAHRAAVLCRQRLALPGGRENRVLGGEIGERQIGGVAVIARQHDVICFRLRHGAVEQIAGRDALPFVVIA